jgi:hypothetical protein
LTGDASDEDISAYGVQSDIPTWTDAVEILVNANLDSRKRNPSSGRSGGDVRSRPRRRD